MSGSDDRPVPASMSVHHLCVVVGVGEADLRSWVANEWVRPRQERGQPHFAPADVARIRLILDLRDAMALDEAAIPVVLGLVDQLYAERTRVRALCEAIQSAGLTETVWRQIEPE